MVGQKRDELLSEIERERLTSRKLSDRHIFSVNVVRVTRKLAAWLANISDVALILQHLPDRPLRRLLDNNAIFSILDLGLSALCVAGIPQILEGEFTPTGKYVIGSTDLPTRESVRPGYREILRRASPEEIERTEGLRQRVAFQISFLSDQDAIEIIKDIRGTRPSLESRIDIKDI